MKEEKREELENEKVTGVGKDAENHINKESQDKTPDVQENSADISDKEKQEENAEEKAKEKQEENVNGQVKEKQDINVEEKQEIKQNEEVVQEVKYEVEHEEKGDTENKAKDEAKVEEKDEAKDEAKDEVKDDVKDDEKDEVKDDEKDDVKDKAKDKAKDDVKDEAKDEAKDEVNQEVKQEQNDQLNGELKEEQKDQPNGESLEKLNETQDPERNEETGNAEAHSTIESNEHDQTEESEDASRQGKKGRLWKKLLIGFGGFLLLCVLGVYIGGAVYFQDKFFFNTKVNGIDVSKQTVEMVDNSIANKIHKYTITLSERGKVKEKITADQIGYHYVSKGEVQGFKDQQNPYTWPRALWENYRYKFDSSTTYDEKKLAKTLKSLECMNEKNIVAPKDAFMKFGETTYEIEPEVEGNKVDYEKMVSLVKNLIEHGEKKASLEKNDCYVQPAVRSDNEHLNMLMNNLNQYCRTSITFAFGEKREVLDGKTIKDWVSHDEAGTVTFDEEQVRNYVAMLADKYDTYDRPREFKTNDGSMVTVKGGSYGWMIDQEQEIVDLTKLIQLGAVQERTPAFARTAVSFDNSDLGQDYVEIDLTRQHLWMYIGGQVAVSSDFVSGSMVKAGCATPGGTYTLYYKKSPDVLRSDKPGDSYATPVTYWMPFNGGIGLHDANWRGSFGGNIYQYNGSHGCINLPTDAARQIYEQIYKGFPIICYYR